MLRALIVLAFFLALLEAGCEYRPYTPPSIGHRAEMEVGCAKQGRVVGPSRLPGGLACYRPEDVP